MDDDQIKGMADIRDLTKRLDQAWLQHDFAGGDQLWDELDAMEQHAIGRGWMRLKDARVHGRLDPRASRR